MKPEKVSKYIKNKKKKCSIDGVFKVNKVFGKDENN
jgi:hypothetical protein